MLVNQFTAEYVLVRGIIYMFSYTGLICLFYFFLALSIGGVQFIAHPFSIAIEVLGAIEILFYLFWFLPYRHYLHSQKPIFPPPLLRNERAELFDKTLGTVRDVELFVKGWMGGAGLEDLRREDVKLWLLWALWDREGIPGNDEEELEGYVDRVEAALGREIKGGWGKAKGIRLSFGKFEVSHRSLMFYLIIGFIDFATSMTLLISGFRFYRQPRRAFFSSFPLRPLTLLAPKQSASPNFSYFHRPHKSPNHRPLVFIHGVGVGLFPYLLFLSKIPKDVGILAIEVLPTSSRITRGLPLPLDIMCEFGDIVTQQNLPNFVMIGNSFGTFFTRQFLDSQYLSSRMHSIIMLDPVTVLLGMPDTAANFTTRVPVEANEWELWWAAQTEPDIAFNLSRRFCWREHVVWKEDLVGKPVTLIMGGKDCIVNPIAIASYITRDYPTPDGELERERWTKSIETWTGEGLELVWLEGYDHGQWLMSSKVLPKITKIIESYCTIAHTTSAAQQSTSSDNTRYNSKPYCSANRSRRERRRGRSGALLGSSLQVLESAVHAEMSGYGRRGRWWRGRRRDILNPPSASAQPQYCAPT
ncbi:hypothetical protein P154DRAFT_593145 [Amniculicola lignicola CBS 123094]|uniref:AB hydrolase-1 domain-containing protein n=1 Tax=Amniculicola lignicola CBS 123094 TaxID=1392246 RepID=A0A6A5X3U9_9PLEO|nr:hypothetical protein P154DRAFT_593145 [Amniculicola lignicola CBS 123094]